MLNFRGVADAGFPPGFGSFASKSLPFKDFSAKVREGFPLKTTGHRDVG